MKQYIEVTESRDHYCNACGKRFDDESMEQKKMYNVSFVQDLENGNRRSQSFRICWNCSKVLTKEMEKARYNSMCDTDDNNEEERDTIENDAYLHRCKCPKCNNKLARGNEERLFYCEYCGTKLHQRAFTQEEINEALFQHEMDEYED